ncbi:1,2-phenylacetyl-CoA epoxidase subunit PaaC [Microbacterium paludicola]|uniref:1,2-phenylacetyl-CoA epoxidase subunit PaaC n=1 Tax=Microbacterium paludicola TaxID=300019 RepID=UPI0031DB8446
MSADTAHAADHHGDVEVDALDLADELPGSGGVATPDVAEYAMRLGDDALILSQQLGWWIARAPELEEDLALGNIALDLLGHARALLRYAGTASGRSEDDLAYWRDEPDLRCCWVVQQPNGDFGDTIARQLIVSAYQVELYDALTDSTDAGLRAIAEKAVREVSYHRDHAVQWTRRLAGGTEESRRRITRALTDLWPYVEELFVDDDLSDRLGDAAPRPSALREGFDATIDAVLAEAELERPQVKPAMAQGRLGRHTSHLGYILAEMQWLARRHPGATW